EALALAIRSDWSKTGDKRRQIVVVWTDASAHPLEKGAANPPGYPADCPRNLDDLTDMWEGQSYVSRAGKRLILYAPDAEAWTRIANSWENTVHYPSKAGRGLSDINYKEILTAIANSV